jgi:NAD(P)H-hydrate epimerase
MTSDETMPHLFAEPPDLAPLPTVEASSLPWLTVEQMAEADQLAMNTYGITAVQMVELAGAALAEVVMRLAPYGLVTVLAGAGTNGAGGLCAARHLADRGRDVEIVIATPHPGPAAQRQLQTLAAMGISPAARPLGDVIVDSLLGYGATGPLEGTAAELATLTRDRAMVVSLDAPSGFGFPSAVDPDATITLALPKEGLATLRPLYLADIGIPTTLWQSLGVDVGAPFCAGLVVEIVG